MGIIRNKIGIDSYLQAPAGLSKPGLKQISPAFNILYVHLHF